jgi:hypothetical protein
VQVGGASSATTGADKFTYAGPIVSQVNPNHGPQTGGTSFWIHGGGFPPYNFSGPSMYVFFGGAQTGVSCMGNVQFATSDCDGITPPSVSGPGTVDVVAHAFSTTSAINPGDKFTYDAFPTLIAFSGPGQGLTEARAWLNGYAPNGGAPITVTSSDPNVVKLTQGTVTIPAGKTLVDIPLTIFPTPNAAAVTLKATYMSVTLSSVINVPASPPIAILTPSELSHNETDTVTVTLNTPAPNGGAQVTLTSSDQAAVPVQGTLTIDAGTYSKTFQITDGHSGAKEILTITAGYNGKSASDTTLLDTTIPPPPVCGGKKCPTGYHLDVDSCTCAKGLPKLPQ